MTQRRGLTLMELMVGLVLTGAVALIGGAAFNSIIEHRRVIVESTADTERASALRDLLRTWIGSGTISLTTGGAQARGGTAITRPTITAPTTSSSTPQLPTITAAATSGDELTFTTNALTPLETPATRVRLFVDGDPSTPETGLTIEYQPTVTNQAIPLQRRQLDSTIVMMTVEFLDQTTNQWYPYSEASTIQPIAARVYFPAVDGYYVPPLLQYPMLFVISSPTNSGSATGRSP